MDDSNGTEDEIYPNETNVVTSTEQNSSQSKLELIPKSFDLGNGHLHILPCKISHTGPCRVSSFFDTQIKLDEKNQYTSSFRGRLLNGRKILMSENLIVSHCKIQRRNKHARIVSKRQLENYFVWKFNEDVPDSNNFVNMDGILNNLDVLK